MQLIILIFASLGLGFWFARSDASRRLTAAAKDASSRLRRNTKNEQTESTGDQAQPSA